LKVTAAKDLAADSAFSSLLRRSLAIGQRYWPKSAAKAGHMRNYGAPLGTAPYCSKR